MDLAQRAEALDLLSMLFEAFPTSGDKTSETTAKAYLLAIDGYSLPALREGIRRLIRGEVEEHNGKFIPTTALLSRVVKYEEDRIRILAATANRKRLDRARTDNVVELDPETRARRREQLAQLVVKLQSM
jgi:hypothetical protein